MLIVPFIDHFKHIEQYFSNCGLGYARWIASQFQLSPISIFSPLIPFWSNYVVITQGWLSGSCFPIVVVCAWILVLCRPVQSHGLSNLILERMTIMRKSSMIDVHVIVVFICVTNPWQILTLTRDCNIGNGLCEWDILEIYMRAKLQDWEMHDRPPDFFLKYHMKQL